MPQPRKLHIIKRRRSDGEDGTGTSNSSWVALVPAEVILPSPGAAWGCCVAHAAPPAQLGQARRRRAGCLHRQLDAEVFH